MINTNKMSASILATASLVMSLTSCGRTPRWMESDSKKDAPVATEVTVPEVIQPSIPEDPTVTASIVNNSYLKTSVNLDSWLATNKHGESSTIAIFDNGFGGLKLAVGKRLPANLAVEKPAIENESKTPHGTVLAQIIFAMTSGSPKWTPESRHPKLKLYNTNGFSNLVAAVDKAIADRVDTIVYSQVWEFGGNFDGRGFINAAVNKATSAGILWINAAGNYAASSWQGKLVTNADGSAALPYLSKYVRLVVKDPSTKVKISLSWNDFTDDRAWKTPRDLDLSLLDSNLKLIIASKRIQDGLAHDNSPDYSAHAYEVISTTLQPGTYLIMVDVKSKNFDSSSSIRLSADGQNISFTDVAADASVMIPADNSSVLTVGASDFSSSAYGTILGGKHKPEVSAPSVIEFETGFSLAGSSTAAAVAAAALTIYQEACGKMPRSTIVEKIQSGALSQQSTLGRGLWLPDNALCR
jgi:hypothetical protein